MRGGPAILAVALAALVAACGSSQPPPGSTLDGTFRDPDGDGVLQRGAGEPLTDRTDIASPGRVARTLATLAVIADAHVTDEESPLRGEVLDRLGGPVASAFRPQESLTTQVLAAAVDAVNAERPDLVLVEGDLVDNAQANEEAWAATVLRGGTVRPDSGRRGYDGLQAATSPDPFLWRPDVDAPRHPGLLAAAQAPFRSAGLQAPWVRLLSNHDVSVQGLIAPDAELSQFAQGTRKLAGLERWVPAFVREGTAEAAAAARRAMTDPDAPVIHVPADPARRLAPATATPLDRQLAPGLWLIGIDTADRSGGAQGVVTPDQLAWLADRLRAHAGARLLVAASSPLEETAGGDAALALLDRTPGVLAVLAADTHRSRVRPHGNYWLIRSPSLADWPEQVRMVRVVQLTDGRPALETWLVDHAGRDGAGGYLGLAGISRDLAYLDAQGGRPKGYAGTALDRNVRLYLP
jgi:3',5'-cyclic AMP phosphodiesterase CpdA